MRERVGEIMYYVRDPIILTFYIHPEGGRGGSVESVRNAKTPKTGFFRCEIS